TWLFGILFLGVMTARVSGQENDRVLEDDIQTLFKKKNFSPKMLPSGPFAIKDVDPLLLRVLWETVRADLSELLQRRLRFESAPSLSLAFLSVNDPEWKKPERLRIVFVDPGNDAARRALASVLKLPPRSFVSNDQYPLYQQVNEAISIPEG